MPYRRRRGMRGLGDCTDPSNWDPDVCGPNPLSSPPMFIGPLPQNPVVPYNFIGPLQPGQTYAPPPGPVWPTSQTPPPNPPAYNAFTGSTATATGIATAPFDLNSFLQKYGLYVMLAAGGLFLFAMVKGGRKR